MNLNIHDMNDINFLYSKNELLNIWFKKFPSSFKNKVKNILSIDSEDPLLDENISNYFPNFSKYYLSQSNYDCYKNSIEKLFGKFKFKISYSDIFDYEIDPCISYDLIIIFTSFDLNKISDFIKRCFDLLSDDGKIFIVTCKHDDFVLECRNYFDLNFTSDFEFKNNLDLDCKLFNTNINTYLNLDNLSKNEMLKLTNENIDDEKLSKFKNFAISKYDTHVIIPISIFILSKNI